MLSKRGEAMRAGIGVIVLAGVAWACHGAELRSVEAVRAETEILVDGELSEACWQQGSWNQGFSVLDMPGKQAEAQSRFKVLHDDANLYIGVEMDEPHPGDMVANIAERDGRVYLDDCVEVMVDATGERIVYYHFVVNSKGVVLDTEFRQGGQVSSVEWDAHIETAARVHEQTWTVELRIPVIELGLTAASRGDWALNVTRERQTGGRELSSFVPVTGGFHQPSLYAVLRLPEADFGRFLWEIKPPYEEQLSADSDGALRYRAKTHVRNAGMSFQFIILRGSLEGTQGDWVRDGLDAGQGREYEFSVPVAREGRQNLVMELVDRDTPDAMLAIKTVPLDVAYNPLTLTLVKPGYRDAIYSTESVNELVFDVRAAVPGNELETLRLLANFVPNTGAQDAPLARLDQPAAAEVTMRLAIPPLPDGDYRLEVRLVDSSGTERYRADKRIRKLPRVEHEWRIDEHNVLLHNGEPVLPFGWFSMPAEKMAEPGHAYVGMQSYGSHWLSDERLKEELDKVAAAKTVVVLYPYPNPRMLEAAAWGQPLGDDEAEALQARVRVMKEHPGILAWYMADEPELRPALPERCRAIYELVAEEDPFHPCIMLNDTIAGISKYVDGGDILMPDPYPCFIKGGLAAQPIEKTGQFIRAAVDAGKGRKAVWVTPQAFNYGDYGRQNQRGPNFVELRNQLYQSVIYGAKGFLWYTHSHTQNYPDIGLGMPWLSFEVADLKEAILAEPAENVTITVESDVPEHLHVSARRVNGELFVFAVSTATEPLNARLAIAPAPGMPSLYVVSEERNLSLVDGAAIEDRFDIYATHIYTTDTLAGGRTGMARILEQISQAEAARRKPGNLAFEDFETRVEFSSKSTYGSTADRVVDGIENGMRWQDGTPRELPDWLTVRWPEPVTLKRAVVFSPTLADFEVQVPDGDGWRTVGQVQGNTGHRAEVVFNPAVQSDALRVYITGLTAGATQSEIWEVEAYAE